MESKMNEPYGGYNNDPTAQAWQQIQTLGDNGQAVNEQQVAVSDEAEGQPGMTHEARTLGARAAEFFEEHFPNLTQKVKESRIYRAIAAGLGRMDATKAADTAQANVQGWRLPEDYDIQLLDSAQGEMRRAMEEMYADDSRLVKGMGEDGLSEDEEIAWELAEEPRKPGELNLVSLFMKNPRVEGETVEDYKARLHNYQKQNTARKDQIVADVAYVEVHPEESVKFNEAKGMIHDAGLVEQYPKAARAMRLAQARPDKEVRDEDGNLDLTWFYQAYPRRQAETLQHYDRRTADEARVGADDALEVVYDMPQAEETLEEYTERIKNDNPGLTNEEMQQFLADQKENAEWGKAESEDVKEETAEENTKKPPVRESVRIKDDIKRYREEIAEIEAEGDLMDSQRKQIMHDQEKIAELEVKMRAALQKELKECQQVREAIIERIDNADEQGRATFISSLEKLNKAIAGIEQELKAA